MPNVLPVKNDRYSDHGRPIHGFVLSPWMACVDVSPIRDMNAIPRDVSPIQRRALSVGRAQTSPSCHPLTDIPIIRNTPSVPRHDPPIDQLPRDMKPNLVRTPPSGPADRSPIRDAGTAHRPEPPVDRRRPAAISAEKHGVTFAEAMTVFGDTMALDDEDREHSEDEGRRVIAGRSDQQRVLTVVTPSEQCS